jgi:hypothetical protein
MPKVRVTFNECVQDSQEYGSDDEHMVSRIALNIAVDGKDLGVFITDLKQTVGSDFETGSIEVTRPVEAGDPKRAYRGPFDQQRFADEVEKYFRQLVGAQGWAIKLGPGAQARMHDNRYVARKVVEFDATGRSEAW